MFKRIVVIVLTFVTIIGALSFIPINNMVVEAAGDIIWTVNEDEDTLTIAGTGAMSNWGRDVVKPPWRKYRDSIEKIVIRDGVTHIGDYAFEQFTALTSVTIPDSVTSIGYYSFGECESLEYIPLSDNIKSIDRFAFYNCYSLDNVKLPKNIKQIEYGTFMGCESLRSIYIPYGVTRLNNYAFASCRTLNEIYLPSSIEYIAYGVFDNSLLLANIYYNGTQEDWDYIIIQQDGNQSIKNAKIHFSTPFLAITKQPTNASAPNGGAISVTITAQGHGLEYQWYVCEPGKNAFSKSSVTGSVYETTMKAEKSGRKVYCLVTDSYGDSIKSNTVTLSCSGFSVTFDANGGTNAPEAQIKQ